MSRTNEKCPREGCNNSLYMACSRPDCPATDELLGTLLPETPGDGRWEVQVTYVTHTRWQQMGPFYVKRIGNAVVIARRMDEM